MGILLGSSSWPPLSDLGAFLMKPKLVPSFHTQATQMSQKPLQAAFRIVSWGSTGSLQTSRGSVPSSIFAQCRLPLDFNWITLSWAFFFSHFGGIPGICSDFCWQNILEVASLPNTVCSVDLS